MTYCKNCHKMSKDDDFCSHCGSAVWGEDFVSNNAAINCDSLENHTHDKVTYSRTERGEGVHIPEGYRPYNPTNNNTNTSSAGKGNLVGVMITIAVIITIIGSFVGAISDFLD